MNTDVPARGESQPDCTQVLARLAFFIDHELAEADAEKIRHHLDECRPCLDMEAVERTIKAVVARSCCESAPSTLRERVLVQLREIRVGDMQVREVTVRGVQVHGGPAVDGHRAEDA